MYARASTGRPGQARPMAIPTRQKRRQAGATRDAGKIARPNRIHDLWKERGWTAADVAMRVRELARERGDAGRAKTHEGTINRLSTGRMTLDHDWMQLLGEVYGVPASEIIDPPPAAGMRRVRVAHAFEVGAWLRADEEPSVALDAIMIPDDPRLRDVSLYAGEIKDAAMSQRYPPGAIVVLSPLLQRPNEIAEGRRYHVTHMREDQATEHTIKTLVRRDDTYWLKPESDEPQLQAWLPLRAGSTRVELVGRVRGVYLREE